MKKLYGYIKSGWYNIRHNKAYALFVVFGTALTFIFVTVVLQLLYIVAFDSPPFVNDSRVVELNGYVDKQGNPLPRVDVKDISNITADMPNYAGYYINDYQFDKIIVGDNVTNVGAKFADAGYWQVNDFKFVEGRSFSTTENERGDRVAVITKGMADSYFRDGSALGKTFEFQNNNFSVIGVINDISIFNQGDMPTPIILPEKFNVFFPDMDPYYEIFVMFDKGTTQEQIKKQTVRAIKQYYGNMNQEVDIEENSVKTQQEKRVEEFGGGLLSYGAPILIFLLLLIPAINIMTLGHANSDNRALEIAVRRAMGASVFSSFMMIMAENILLVFTGIIIGVIFASPTANLIMRSIMGEGSLSMGSTMIPETNFRLILLAVLPLALLFSIMSGGIPAYIVSKRNIVKTLKGEL